MCRPDHLRSAPPPWYGRRMSALRAITTTTMTTIPLGEGECRSVLD